MVEVKAQSAARLRAEIHNELRNLGRTVADVEARREAQDDTTTYALALLLMNYYTGAERIFQRIAAQLGGAPPQGERWHAQLLEDMALDIDGVRPAVLSLETAAALLPLLRFRHIIRNLYAWTLHREEMAPHLVALTAVHARLEADFAQFTVFLDALAAPPAF